jgi:hypothetical protein
MYRYKITYRYEIIDKDNYRLILCRYIDDIIDIKKKNSNYNKDDILASYYLNESYQ